MTARLEVRTLSKAFGGVQAVRGVASTCTRARSWG